MNKDPRMDFSNKKLKKKKNTKMAKLRNVAASNNEVVDNNKSNPSVGRLNQLRAMGPML